MKKKITILFAAITIMIAGSIKSNAQEIGVRFGDVSGGSVAIDAIFSTGDFNRVHADVSFGNGVAIDMLWDFIYRPLGDEALNWYMGLGPYLGILDGAHHDDDETDFNLGVAFEIGLEYRFESVPIAIGVDYRPTLEIIDHTDFHFGGFGINIRYVLDSL